MNEENKENAEDNKELIATCIQCGFSAHPEKFHACISVYHHLRCPDCGTTNIDWTYGSYRDNTLVLD